MKNNMKHNLHIIKNSVSNFLESINDHSEHDVPKVLLYFFISCEYISYIIATLTIIFTFFLSTKNLYKFFLKKEKPVSDILKIRLIIGHILNLALTIILAGHIIRLVYSSNMKTIFFLVIVLLVRELLVYFLDREVKIIYKDYNLIKKESNISKG